MDENRLRKIFSDIIETDADDSITFEIADISPIRDEDAYGGFSIFLIGRLENVRQSFHVDVAMGDPITPSDIEYTYQSLISNETIAFRAYNLETIIAEKLQTIFPKACSIAVAKIIMTFTLSTNCNGRISAFLI